MSSLHSAAVRNATSSSKPSRDFESFIALARSAKHFRALHFKRNPETNAAESLLDFAAFAEKLELSRFIMYSAAH